MYIQFGQNQTELTVVAVSCLPLSPTLYNWYILVLYSRIMKELNIMVHGDIAFVFERQVVRLSEVEDKSRANNTRR